MKPEEYLISFEIYGAMLNASKTESRARMTPEIRNRTVANLEDLAENARRDNIPEFEKTAKNLIAGFNGAEYEPYTSEVYKNLAILTEEMERAKIKRILEVDNNEFRISLDSPKDNYVKYIFAKDARGRQVVISSNLRYHEDIVKQYQSLSGEQLKEITGGRIRMVQASTGKQMVLLYDSSDAYGKANHSFVANLLRNNGLEALTEDSH
ncbi:MAG: hypothetical protein WCK90_03590 [archaeon]